MSYFLTRDDGSSDRAVTIWRGYYDYIEFTEDGRWRVEDGMGVFSKAIGEIDPRHTKALFGVDLEPGGGPVEIQTKS